MSLLAPLFTFSSLFFFFHFFLPLFFFLQFFYSFTHTRCVFCFSPFLPSFFFSFYRSRKQPTFISAFQTSSILLTSWSALNGSTLITQLIWPIGLSPSRLPDVSTLLKLKLVVVVVDIDGSFLCCILLIITTTILSCCCRAACTLCTLLCWNVFHHSICLCILLCPFLYFFFFFSFTAFVIPFWDQSFQGFCLFAMLKTQARTHAQAAALFNAEVFLSTCSWEELLSLDWIWRTGVKKKTGEEEKRRNKRLTGASISSSAAVLLRHLSPSVWSKKLCVLIVHMWTIEKRDWWWWKMMIVQYESGNADENVDS